MRRWSFFFLTLSLVTTLSLSACSGDGLSARSLEDRLEDALSFEGEEEQSADMPASMGVDEAEVAEVDEALVPAEIRAEQRFVLLLMVKGPDLDAVKFIRIAIQGLDGRHVRIPVTGWSRAPASGAIVLETQLALDRKLFDQTFLLDVAAENALGQLGPRYPVILHVGNGTCREAAETCNLVDDNCDGQVDEGFSGLYHPCDAGTAACPVQGVLACAEDGSALTCFGDPGLAEGRACDDQDLCTHTDTCDAAGACRGTAVTCQDDPTDCGLRRACNGTAACDESYPEAGTDCEDGLFCSVGDTCDGLGACLAGAESPCLVDGELCFEDEDQCCQQDVARTCDANGDAYWMDSCGHLGVLIEDCPQNATCDTGVCSCIAGWSGPGCDVAADCAAQPDFTKCDDGDPTRAWDICASGQCISPGCGFTSCNPSGAHFRVPDTNLRVCSDEQAEIACPDTSSPYYGQDAQYGWDMSHQASERYQVSDPAGTSQMVVVDRITGLMWQQTTTQGPLAEAMAACDSSTWAGFDDWHLPTAAELVTLVAAVPTNPSIDQTAFPDAQSIIHWTIEATGLMTDEYWAVDFRLGGIQSANAFNQGYAGRCVRGGGLGADPATGRFQTTDPLGADQLIVTDSVTRLTWMHDPGINAFGYLPWTESIGACEASTWAGFADWRMPDVQEILSLVDHRYTYPAMDMDVFGSFPEGYMWTSTSAGDNPAMAQTLDVQTGVTMRQLKIDMAATICVRGDPAP